MTPPPFARRAREARSSEIRDLLKLTQGGAVISFAGGLPSPAGFPVAALREAFDRVLADEPATALQYSTTEGDPGLRAWIAARESARGCPTAADDVLIVGGSQQALDLVGKVFIDPGDTVLVESPSYLGALQAFAQYAPRLRGVAADDDGLDPAAVDAACTTRAAAGEPPRVLYVLPTFQNPTGRTLPEARRIALAATARRHDLWLVEDDPYGDLWFDHAPPPSLRAFAPERTVRLGSFSKILAPGLRLGYAIAPPAVRDALVRLKQATDLHTGTLTQRAALRLVETGMLEAHLPAVRARYRTHAEAMLTALAAHLPAGAHWSRPQGGMFVWAELPAPLDATALLPAAVAAGVAFVPGTAFYAEAPNAGTLRLSYATVAPADIVTGMARLGRVIAAALRFPPMSRPLPPPTARHAA